MNIDANKLARIQEAAGWLKQAEVYYKGLRYDIGDDCVKRARLAVNDSVFDRKPIIGFSRNEQPDVVRVVADNPLGYAIINGYDYDETVHRLYVEGSSDKPSKRR